MGFRACGGIKCTHTHDMQLVGYSLLDYTFSRLQLGSWRPQHAVCSCGSPYSASPSSLTCRLESVLHRCAHLSSPEDGFWRCRSATGGGFSRSFAPLVTLSSCLLWALCVWRRCLCFMHSTAARLLPCGRSAWLMAPSSCLAHSTLCIRWFLVVGGDRVRTQERER